MKPGEDKQATPEGVEIPVPTRNAVFDDLRKVAKPESDHRKRSAHKK